MWFWAGQIVPVHYPFTLQNVICRGEDKEIHFICTWPVDLTSCIHRSLKLILSGQRFSCGEWPNFKNIQLKLIKMSQKPLITNKNFLGILQMNKVCLLQFHKILTGCIFFLIFNRERWLCSWAWNLLSCQIDFFSTVH